MTRRIGRAPAALAGRLRLLAFPFAIVALLAFSATPAFGAKTHRLITTFGTGVGPGVAVEEASDNVFASATHFGPPGPTVSNTVDIYGPEGGSPSGIAAPFTIEGFEWSGGFGGRLAVDNAPTSPAKGDLYVVEKDTTVKKFSLNPISEKYELKEELSASPPFEHVADVAVDTKGNVFVSDFEASAVIEFDPTGAQVARLAEVAVGEDGGSVAVDSAGDLFVVSSGGVSRYDANGSGEIEPGTEPVQIVKTRVGEGPGAGHVAVDLSTDSLYVGMSGAVLTGSEFERERVDQYDASCTPEGEGKEEHCAPEGEFGLGVIGGVNTLAVNSATGNVYVADGGNHTFQKVPKIYAYGPSIIVPAAVTGEATAVTGTSATLAGTIDPSGSEVDECKFEWGESTQYGHTTSCAESPAEIGSGNAPKAVHADIPSPSLGFGTKYHFRLIATSATTVPNEIGPSAGADRNFTTLGPQVHAQSAALVTDTTAKLEGLVNPNKEATSYVFEYVSDADFEADEYAKASSAPLGGQAIGSGTEDIEVAQQLGGLSPFTTYHFRIAATNATGSAHGPDETFTTYIQAPVGLPDGRVYEQVTPVDKNGAAPTGNPELVQAALNGDGITFASAGAIPGTEGGQAFPTYLATRGSDWSTQGLLPPASEGANAAVLGWSEDLAQIYDLQGPLVKPPSFLQRESATHLTRAIVSDVNASFHYIGSSADSSTVVFESAAQLVEGASTKGVNTYVWDQASGELRLAGVLNSGAAPFKGAFAGSNDAAFSPHYNQAERAVSSDGSRVFFSDAGLGQLYVRENPTQPQSALEGGKCTEAALACTVNISASQRAVPDPKAKKPVFISATPDGEVAFFTSAAKLTEDATTGPNDDGNDLYRYELGTGKLTDLTPDTEAGDPNGAEVQGVLGASEDGSYLYFAANGVLASGASHGNCSEATNAGSCNLYLAHAGVTTFIAPLQQGAPGFDGSNWYTRNGDFGAVKTARVSADGQALLFSSGQKLSAYENGGTPELYRYSASEKELDCVSCNPTGAAPLAAPALRDIRTPLGNVPPPASILTRNLSADGNQVFFETPDKLVASDTNGAGGCEIQENGSSGARTCQDVYEWEAKGTGSCESDFQNGGCLYLLSSGTSPEPAYFGDASASGEDAFIFTIEPLVGQDKDQIRDIYDARVGGGIASQNPPPAPPLCEGEACKGPVAVAPVSNSPGSASFTTAGNPKPSRHKKHHHKKKKQHKKRQATNRKHR